MVTEPSKRAFLNTWPGGYAENWAVYGAATGITEAALVKTCLAPFYNREHVALEIGCGLGFWTDGYLAPHFREVIALDLFPNLIFKHPNVKFVEVPDRNYECFGVADGSVDFVWSFGVFCHLTLPSIQRYLASAFRTLKPGGQASLYFSNTDRRPGVGSADGNTEDQIIWVTNNWATTEGMLKQAGFVGIRDLLPFHKDTMAYARKAR